MPLDRSSRVNALVALCAALVALPFAVRLVGGPVAALCVLAIAAAVFIVFTLADRAGA
jgi:hypothetical protein